MDRAINLQARYYGGAEQWVLEPSRVAEILSTLDREVVLERQTPGGASTQDRQHFELTVFWPEGSEPFRDLPAGSGIFYQIDLVDDVMAHGDVQLQWAVPPEFSDLLFRYLSDMGPTPVPPLPTASPTPIIVSPAAIPFDHPAGKLIWDGPDDRVTSRPSAHCGFHGSMFDAPAQIAVKDLGVYWGVDVLRRQDGWRWTGYSHDEWQIWQGGDGRIIYLVHAEERDIAFKYRNFICV